MDRHPGSGSAAAGSANGREAEPQFQLDEALLADVAQRRPFFKGRLIGVQGQRCEEVQIIAEGQVLLCRENDRGDDYSLYLLGPGELFGEGALHPDAHWLVTARAVTDGAAYVLPAAGLSLLFKHYPQLGARVLALYSLRLERSHRRLDVTQQTGAKARILKLLHVMAEYHGESNGARVWMPSAVTQAELGEMVGLARETVARVLAELEEEGAIRRDGRRGLWLTPADHR